MIKPMVAAGQTFSNVWFIRASRHGNQDGGSIAVCYCKLLTVGSLPSDIHNYPVTCSAKGTTYFEGAQETTTMNEAERQRAPYERLGYLSVGTYWDDVEILRTTNGSRFLFLKEVRMRESEYLHAFAWNQSAICETERDAIFHLDGYLLYIGVPPSDVRNIQSKIWNKFIAPPGSLQTKLLNFLARICQRP